MTVGLFWPTGSGLPSFLVRAVFRNQPPCTTRPVHTFRFFDHHRPCSRLPATTLDARSSKEGIDWQQLLASNTEPRRRITKERWKSSDFSRLSCVFFY
jgi:hypothetical protein